MKLSDLLDYISGSVDCLVIRDANTLRMLYREEYVMNPTRNIGNINEYLTRTVSGIGTEYNSRVGMQLVITIV